MRLNVQRWRTCSVCSAQPEKQASIRAFFFQRPFFGRTRLRFRNPSRVYRGFHRTTAVCIKPRTAIEACMSSPTQGGYEQWLGEMLPVVSCCLAVFGGREPRLCTLSICHLKCCAGGWPWCADRISRPTVPCRTCKCGRRVAPAGLMPRATMHVNSATAFVGSNWQPAGVPFQLRCASMPTACCDLGVLLVLLLFIRFSARPGYCWRRACVMSGGCVALSSGRPSTGGLGVRGVLCLVPAGSLQPVHSGGKRPVKHWQRISSSSAQNPTAGRWWCSRQVVC
jgi:hypothetical protein